MGRIRLNPFRRKPSTDERGISTVNDYIEAFKYSGNVYQYPHMDPGLTTTMGKNVVSQASPDFLGNAITQRRNGVVAACLDIRQSVFSATRFQWQRVNNGTPSATFGSQDLAILERPWPGGTTQDLLALMLADADLAGNSYWVREADRLVRLRPDWVNVVLEPILRLDTTAYPKERYSVIGYRAAGYLYTEGGGSAGEHSATFTPDEVAHFMPRVDPAAPWRGMSWLTPLLRSEVHGDELMTEHKRQFMENAATPNIVVSHDREISPEKLQKFKEIYDSAHAGIENAYKTMYLGGGADVTVVGKDMQQLDFSQVQGAGETRIAAAAGVPPVIVGLSEGLKAATYSNYAQARRRFADGTIHPLWQNAAGSLEHLVKPAGLSPAVRLWYDARNVPFLREDQEQAAEIQYKQSLTIRQYVDAGYTPESAVAAVEADDRSLLEHTGLFSVMLMPPGTTAPDATSAGSESKPPAGSTEPDDEGDA